jgi:hypothetical protein
MNNTNKGWVKLWRDQFTHEISDKKPWCDGYAWSYIYSRANFKPKIVNFRNQYIPVERGQFITSKLKLQEIFGWSQRRVNSFLTSLKVRGMCTNRVTNRFIVLTVCNYDIYQSMTDEDEQTDVNTDVRTGNEQVMTTKNVKNEKKKFAYSRISSLTSFFYNECFTSKGFKPSLDAGDGRAVKGALKSMTEDEVKQAITFYLKSPKAKDCGVTLKAALSTHSINLWKAGKEKTNWQTAQ